MIAAPVLVQIEVVLRLGALGDFNHVWHHYLLQQLVLGSHYVLCLLEFIHVVQLQLAILEGRLRVGMRMGSAHGPC